MTFIIAADKLWDQAMGSQAAALTGQEFVVVSTADELVRVLHDLREVELVFFPHWSSMIPASIHERHECVIFHMTELPYGRGGSPLQNLLIRGHESTVISALRCVAEVDAGPIYLRRPLTLEGRAVEIYRRASDTILEMIVEIARNRPVPVEQYGEVVRFTRRKPAESDISDVPFERVHDFIRMLDAPGYPLAFVETSTLRMEFLESTQNDGHVEAKVRIRKATTKDVENG